MGTVLRCSLSSFCSRYTSFLGAGKQALKDNDEELAKILMDRLDLLERCRMDPTQDVGSYQKDLDADEWYLRNRRASMGKSE